jgi:hypothetical protein
VPIAQKNQRKKPPQITRHKTAKIINDQTNGAEEIPRFVVSSAKTVAPTTMMPRTKKITTLK